jgi:hypothetical protein
MFFIPTAAAESLGEKRACAAVCRLGHYKLLEVENVTQEITLRTLSYSYVSFSQTVKRIKHASQIFPRVKRRKICWKSHWDKSFCGTLIGYVKASLRIECVRNH